MGYAIDFLVVREPQEIICNIVDVLLGLAVEVALHHNAQVTLSQHFGICQSKLPQRRANEPQR